LGLPNLLCEENSRERKLVLAMIVARIIDPRSKLATARGLHDETSFSSLGEILELDYADSDELYQAMDWLLSQQDRIENSLALKHLHEGTVVRYVPQKKHTCDSDNLPVHSFQTLLADLANVLNPHVLVHFIKDNLL
jgi:hypothetical protein